MRARVVGLAALALALIASGCAAGVSTLSLPDPPSTTALAEPPVPTLPGDLASVDERPVPGAATTTVPVVGPGGATLNGTVLGPNGPVAGAVVEADRLVGDAVATAKATTGADGSWSVANVLGGRYRVRAWQSPSLAMSTPQVVFLSSTQTLSLSLQLTQFQGPAVTLAISPNPPMVGEQANLVVQVTNPTVGPDGVVRNPPVVGAAVTLVDGSEWDVFNGNPSTTDASGDVLFQVACAAPGSDPLSAQVQNQSPLSLQVPECSPPPATTLPVGSTTTCPTLPAGLDLGSTTTSPTFGSC